MADNTILWNIRGLSFEQRSVHIYQESWIYAPYTWATDVRSERPQKSTTVSFYLHHNLLTGTNSNSNTILFDKTCLLWMTPKIARKSSECFSSLMLTWFKAQNSAITGLNHRIFEASIICCFFIVTSGFFVFRVVFPEKQLNGLYLGFDSESHHWLCCKLSPEKK